MFWLKGCLHSRPERDRRKFCSGLMENMNSSHNGVQSNNVADASTIAYFSMEIGLDADIPTYSGGLGILAGDTLRAAADLGVPMVGVTLLHRKGYLHQHLDSSGNQYESEETWYPEEHLQALTYRVSITIEGRPVLVRAWRYLIQGSSGQEVPVYFLDTDLFENAPADRNLTDYLYGGDSRYRLRQEALLGLGGIAMLRALSYHRVRAYHMNEGHSAFLVLALLEEWYSQRDQYGLDQESLEAVRRQCIFTTHTPVAAGHDEFPLDIVREVVGDARIELITATGACRDGRLSMSHLALIMSGYVNGVSQRHGQVSRQIYPGYPIAAVTNGVHAVSWVSQPFSRLYDRYIPEWCRNNQALDKAINIPIDEIQQAHRQAKAELLEEVQRRTGVALDPSVMTIGFARRAVAYKRADLLFTDLERVKKIAQYAGPFQVVYTGKAHPRDQHSKEIIRRVFEAADALAGSVPVLYLENYNMTLGKLLCAGVDLWLNTPQKPMEASGTSGMKAALNAVPSLSVLDGWWVEGHREGVTGWSIDDASGDETSDPVQDAQSLYYKLEHVILPMFYHQPEEYAQIMRSAIALNGSYFNTHRMLAQYLKEAYCTADDYRGSLTISHFSGAYAEGISDRDQLSGDFAWFTDNLNLDRNSRPIFKEVRK
jgi:glycogen phosphorylase